jgi:glutaminyl-peptide cyclotransferase
LHRSLAEQWDSTPHTALSTYRTALGSINLFLLLDLLGTEKPKIPSYFKTTHWAYQELAKIELRLRSLGLLGSKPDHPFLPESDKDTNNFNPLMGIQDDHIPFMARGVEILHIIPYPFPTVWHTMQDDGDHLDIATVEDWARIVTAFVGEWMDLEGYFPPKTQADAMIKEKRMVSRKTEL